MDNLSQRADGLAEISRSPSGSVFNVQGYSIHDGPGIRTTVFLKGCPLTCLWCQNPEAMAKQPQVFFDSDKCRGCGQCVAACPERAIEIVAGKARTDRQLCVDHGLCAAVCPSGARSVMGREATADDIFEEIEADAIFYKHSGGGVTISGGEPLAQPKFTEYLLKRCKEAGFHTAIDTSGFAKWSVVEPVMKYVDLVLYDFKHMNPLEHARLTGVSNELILDNAKKIHHQLAIPMLARVPLIPGYNDTPENIADTAKFIAGELSTSIRVHLIPYHPFGEAKYERLEVRGRFFSSHTPSGARVAEISDIFRGYGLAVTIGG